MKKQKSGEPFSEANRKALNRAKRELEELLGAHLIYPEDKIEIKKGFFVIRKFKQIYQEEFGEGGKIHDGRLFNLMLRIFRFSLEISSIKRYFYQSEDGNSSTASTTSDSEEEKG